MNGERLISFSRPSSPAMFISGDGRHKDDLRAKARERMARYAAWIVTSASNFFALTVFHPSRRLAIKEMDEETQTMYQDLARVARQRYRSR